MAEEHDDAISRVGDLIAEVSIQYSAWFRHVNDTLCDGDYRY